MRTPMISIVLYKLVMTSYGFLCLLYESPQSAIRFITSPYWVLMIICFLKRLCMTFYVFKWSLKFDTISYEFLSVFDVLHASECVIMILFESAKSWYDFPDRF